MDVAIVTGADTRFGDAVCRTLLKMGFRIHALGQHPDAAGYDERYYLPHAYGAGRLAELKTALEEVIASESRVDLLVGLGGPEIVTGWEDSSPEALVRRLHGCLTEPLLAASVCLGALKKSKGFLIHGHRRPVSADLQVFPGYFEDSMKKAYDDLFLRNAESGLRSARVLYAYPEEEAEENPVYQDIAESVSRAFEIILRQKETCVVREISISPRGLALAGGGLPNLSSAVDPYQTTVLPEGENETQEPILIPTEKPKHYVQIAEVKDITDGDVEVDDFYEDEQEDELDSPSREGSSEEGADSLGKGKSSRPRRRRPRGRSRRARQEDDQNAGRDGATGEDSAKEDGASADSRGREDDSSQQRPQKSNSRRNRSRKPAKKSDGGGPADTYADHPAAPPETEGDEEKPPKKRVVKKSTRKRPSTARKKAAPRKSTSESAKNDGEAEEADSSSSITESP